MASSSLGNLPPELQAQFQALRDGFVAGLRARWDQVLSAPDPVAQRDVLHKLAGASGSYGFDTLCALAREAESQALDGPAAHMQTALDQLDREIVRILGSSPDA